MKRLRLIHTESSCGWGGQELRVLAEGAGMAARGHEVLIAAPVEAPVYAEARARGLATAALPMVKKSFAGWAAMRSLLRRQAADIVITHSSTDSWLAALARVGLSGAAPLIRMRHVSAPIAGNIATQWLYGRAAAHVVTTGEALRQQVIREAHLLPERVTSVPTGIDLETFQPGDRLRARALLDLPQQRFIIGIVATLRSWKGHRFLVDAVAALRDEQVLLVIVGDGPGRDNLQAQVRELGLQDQVLMTGNRKDVADWMQAFDVFVLPSYANEGVPQALMQAMACALPVISTPVGAIGEIVEDGRTGLMVAPRDVQALAAALTRLRGDAQLRQSLAQAALGRARDRFSLERMLVAMEDIFEGVLTA
jgi:glycosyltransferase involved in cell wall biosynthesis